MATYYDILQIRTGSDDRTIRESYFALIGVYHPDRCDGDPDFIHFHASRINEAYSILGDPVKRAEYDAALAAHNRPALVRLAGEARSAAAATLGATARTVRDKSSVALGGARGGIAIADQKARAGLARAASAAASARPRLSLAGFRGRAGRAPLPLLLGAPLAGLAAWFLVTADRSGNDAEIRHAEVSALTPRASGDDGSAVLVSADPVPAAAHPERAPPNSEKAIPARFGASAGLPDRPVLAARQSSAAEPSRPPVLRSEAPPAAPPPVVAVAPVPTRAPAPPVRPSQSPAEPRNIAPAQPADPEARKRACFPILVSEGAPAYNDCLSRR